MCESFFGLNHYPCTDSGQRPMSDPEVEYLRQSTEDRARTLTRTTRCLKFCSVVIGSIGPYGVGVAQHTGSSLISLILVE